MANAIAAEYGFWLGDAFASGGSTGYDHKALGITARGAWESVRAALPRAGHDVDHRPFTRRRHRRHVGRRVRQRHAPLGSDPAGRRPSTTATCSSTRTRTRRARSPSGGGCSTLGAGTSWADYDPTLISAGGGVFPRSAKSMPLTPEMRAALGVAAETLTPAELCQAILRAPVDLLWNGGIGTFVKASRESHDRVGDRANDAIRVDGRELRARVVAEGGNLGATQAGRIEYALGGGRINTDAIDNSAGVDCSDHEVNLKILLDLAVERGGSRRRRGTRCSRSSPTTCARRSCTTTTCRCRS